MKEALSVEDTLKLALEALENLINQHYAETTTNDDLEKADNAIIAIKAALEAHKALMSFQDGAQQSPQRSEDTKERSDWNEQVEPVAVVKGYMTSLSVHIVGKVKEGALLYTNPPTQCSQRTWIGLTDDEIALINADYPHPQGFAKALQAKLKEKNNGSR